VTGQGNVGINGFLTVIAYDRATGARLWRTDANPPTCCAIGSRIALAPDGSLVVAGHTATGGYFDWWIVAFTTSGSVKWQIRRDAAVTGDELPAAVLVLADGTTVVSGTGGPVTRDVLGNSYMQGVTAGYGPNGTLLWEAFSKLPTVWATALPNGDVCATGGYDALVTCWRVPGTVTNLAPVAAISATPLTGAAPLTVSFNGSGSGDPDGTISSWSWSFGDGSSGTGALTNHIYGAAGTFTVRLTVTDNGGASGTATVPVVVNAPQGGRTLVAATLSPTSVVGGSPSTGTVTIDGAAPSGGLVVALASSNGPVASVPATVTVPQGATSATFTVATTPVVVSTPSTISATYGAVTRTTTLTVAPPAAADTVAITLAQYRSSTRRLSVQASSSSGTATLTAYVTATGQRIGALTNVGGGKYSGQFPWSSKPQSITVRSSLGGSASRVVTAR
jgi:PKD repeat protein